MVRSGDRFILTISHFTFLFASSGNVWLGAWKVGGPPKDGVIDVASMEMAVLSQSSLKVSGTTIGRDSQLDICQIFDWPLRLGLLFTTFSMLDVGVGHSPFGTARQVDNYSR